MDEQTPIGGATGGRGPGGQGPGGPRVMGGVVMGNSLSARVIFGIILISLGTLWTLDSFGVLDASAVLRWWPLVLVVLGVQRLTGIGHRRSPVWGGILTVGGMLMLSDNAGWLHVTSGAIWSLALIGFGIMMLRPSALGQMVYVGGVRAGRRRRSRLDDRNIHIGVGEVGPVEDPSSRLQVFSMWSHIIRRVTSQQFQHAEVSAVMGGVRLDLRPAKPVEGGATVDLSVVWGGIEIIVPPTLLVVNEASVLIGGISDQTRQTVNDSRDILILRGAVVMGGVELKND
ncbi:MAG: LiaI-LiaF-like domain-containing protein [Candidatus Eisenbacteria bacterium]